jgi:hypothetical protein
MPSPARTKVIGLPAPVSPARTEGRLKIPLPITPLMIAAVKSQRPMARTRPGACGRPVRVGAQLWLWKILPTIFHPSANR